MSADSERLNQIIYVHTLYSLMVRETLVLTQRWNKGWESK